MPEQYVPKTSKDFSTTEDWMEYQLEGLVQSSRAKIGAAHPEYADKGEKYNARQNLRCLYFTLMLENVRKLKRLLEQTEEVTLDAVRES